MAKLFTFSPVVIVIFTIIILFENISTVQSEPNTTVLYTECSTETYSESDPYAFQLDFALCDMLVDITEEPDYEYYVIGYPGTPTVYAKAETHLSQDDCTLCEDTAVNYLKEMCPYKVGAEVKMVDCCLKYDNKQF